MKLFLLLLLFSTSYSYVLDPLTAVKDRYPVGKKSRVYFICDCNKNQLDSAQIWIEGDGAHSVNGTYLMTPTATGSLTPYIPSQDNVNLGVAFPTNVTGWLYITEQTDLNVYAMSRNLTTTPIKFQPGTNLFFNLYFPNDPQIFLIPTAKKMVVGSSVSVKGLVGVPEANGLKFFDTASITGLTTYDSLELPLPIFHFKTNGTDVKYEISYKTRIGIATQSSGLLMTQAFPVQSISSTNSYEIGNYNRDNIKLYMLARFDPTRFYTVKVSLIFKDTTLPNIVFNMNSTSDYVIQSTSPFTSVLIESDSPYSIQYWLQDMNIHTTTYYSVTEAASGLNLILGIFLAAILNF